MFSQTDADQLRQLLGDISFLKGGAGQADELGADAAKLYAAYLQFYGLDFPRSQAGLDEVTSTIGLFASGGYDLVCQHFLPEQNPAQKTAFLLHGYFDHAGLYGHLIGRLLTQGIGVVVFDLPGHGLSSGATASIGSFQEYSRAFVDCLEHAKSQQLSQPWVALGQSTGAAIIMEALLERSLAASTFQHTILLAPLLRPRHWSRSRLLFRLSKAFVKSTPRKFSRNSHDQAFLSFLSSEDKLQSRVLPNAWVQAMSDYIDRFEEAPALDAVLQIIQGRGDGTVDWEKNIPAIIEKFPGSTVNWIEEAGHHLVNEAMPYRDQLFTLIEENLQASGESR